MAERPHQVWSPWWWSRVAAWSLLFGLVGQTAIAWVLCWFLTAPGHDYAGAWQWGQTKFQHKDMEWVGKRVSVWSPYSMPQRDPALDEQWRFVFINSYPALWSFSRDADETLLAAREYWESPSRGAASGARMEFAAGWPWLSLRGLLRSDGVPTPTGAAPHWRLHGVLAGQSESGSVRDKCRAIPMIPIWSGLAFDTLAFGGSMFLTATIWTGVRRRLRFARGRCPACGYDLSFDLSAGCPECGWRRTPEAVEARTTA